MSTSGQSASPLSVVPDTGASDTAPISVGRRFLDSMVDGDFEAVQHLVHEDIVYSNVSLPSIRGRAAFARFARLFEKSGMRFEVQVHHLAERDGFVLTERTDALILGRFRAQFWVCGTFEVRDGQVVLWRDYFDWLDITRANLRGALGAVVPGLRARF